MAPERRGPESGEAGRATGERRAAPGGGGGAGAGAGAYSGSPPESRRTSSSYSASFIPK